MRCEKRYGEAGTKERVLTVDVRVVHVFVVYDDVVLGSHVVCNVVIDDEPKQRPQEGQLNLLVVWKRIKWVPRDWQQIQTFSHSRLKEVSSITLHSPSDVSQTS
jgi:hypothetical protein